MSEPNRHGVPAATWAQWSEPERMAFNILHDEAVHDILFGDGSATPPLGILQAHGLTGKPAESR